MNYQSLDAYTEFRNPSRSTLFWNNEGYSSSPLQISSSSVSPYSDVYLSDQYKSSTRPKSWKIHAPVLSSNKALVQPDVEGKTHGDINWARADLYSNNESSSTMYKVIPIRMGTGFRSPYSVLQPSPSKLASASPML